MIFIIFATGVYAGIYARHHKTTPYYRLYYIKRNLLGFLNGSTDLENIFKDRKFFVDFFSLPNMADILLAHDAKISSRAFASMIKYNGQFHIFYAGRNAETEQYSIYKRSSPTLHGIKSANEHLLFNPEAIGVKMAWMPYIFKDDDNYHLFFTVREQQISSEGEFDEYVMKATSTDLLDFNIDPTPVLKADLPWEGREVENWGIIKVDDNYYMSYESRGPSQQESERSIGYAVSSDLNNWERMQSKPSITGGVCCSSFFKVGDVYHSIAANGTRFAIHASSTVEGLNDKNLVGYFYPHGTDYKGSVETPEIITDSITKTLLGENDEIILMFSSTKDGFWSTQYVTFPDIEGFIKSITAISNSSDN